jgi:hypothetical protein
VTGPALFLSPVGVALLLAQSVTSVPPPRVQTVRAPGLAVQIPAPQAAAPAAAASAAPIEERNKYAPGNVIISFEGGVVGEDVGAVLLKLANAPNLLKSVPYAVAEGDSPCAIMVGFGYPKPCSDSLLKTLDILNPKLLPSRGHLHAGERMMLPDAWIRPYRTGRVFSGAVATEQRRSDVIKRGWTHLNLGVAKISGSTERVDFDAYDLIIPTADAHRQTLMLQRVSALKSANVRVNAVPFTASAAAAYSIEDPGAYQQQCSKVPPTTPQTIDYRQYADSDGDAASLVSARPEGSRPATVYLLDVALDPSPNLDSAAPAPAAWHCNWSNSADPRHHSTHLASIIASRSNGFGFIGLSPTAAIVSYELLTPNPAVQTRLDVPPGRDVALADFLLDNVVQGTPQVFLVATTIPYEPSYHVTMQIDPPRRFDRQLEHNIQALQPLFVVAAGQDAHPIALSPRAPMSPQNLGDQRNVIVVTACDDCRRDSPTLLKEANYSVEGGDFVQIAAPGGQPMLGWVDHQSIGAASGTSQAAAFAAGIAAEMLSRWPSNYALAETVKKRLQVTSWPLYPRVGVPSDDSDHVATGIVDPVLALLDPSVTWLKDDQRWRQIRVRGFSSDTLQLQQSTGTPIWLLGKSVARIVRVSAPEDAPAYVVYTDAARRTGHAELIGKVMRDGPLEADPALAIVQCTGPPIPLSGVRDLIIANRGIAGQPCG